MPGPGTPRFAGYAQLVWALVLGVLSGLAFPIGGIAQEFEATPIIETRGEMLTASSALTLTLDTEQVIFGQVRAGETVQMDGAVVVTISGSSGTAWQLTCSAAATAAHTTSASVETLLYAPADAAVWTPFQSSPSSCLPPASGDTAVGFDYLVQVPQSATPGVYDLIVTYSVTTLE